MRTCDKHVLPTVLCPWGESEFLHTCGDVPFDSVLQPYMTKCYFKMTTKNKIIRENDMNNIDIRMNTMPIISILLYLSRYLFKPNRFLNSN